MTDDELRAEFRQMDQRFDRVEADVAIVKTGVSAIIKHLDIDEEIENTAHVQDRIGSGGGSSTMPRAAKGDQ